MSSKVSDKKKKNHTKKFLSQRVSEDIKDIKAFKGTRGNKRAWLSFSNTSFSNTSFKTSTPKSKQLKQHTQGCDNQDPANVGILNLSASSSNTNTNTNTNNTSSTDIADTSSADTDSNIIANNIATSNLVNPTEASPNMALSENNRELLIHIENLLGKVKAEIVSELNLKLSGIEARVRNLEEPKDFDPDFTVVVSKLPFEPNEDLPAKVQAILNELGVQHLIPKNIRRLRQKRADHIPIVKIQMATADDKVMLLRAKQKLKDTIRYRKIFIRSSFSHAELVAQSNLRTLMSVLPESIRERVKFSGNGRLNTVEIRGTRN